MFLLLTFPPMAELCPSPRFTAMQLEMFRHKRTLLGLFLRRRTLLGLLSRSPRSVVRGWVIGFPPTGWVPAVRVVIVACLVAGATPVAKRPGTFTLDDEAALGQLDHGPAHRAALPPFLLGHGEQFGDILVFGAKHLRVGRQTAMFAGFGGALGTSANITLDQAGLDEAATSMVMAV